MLLGVALDYIVVLHPWRAEQQISIGYNQRLQCYCALVALSEDCDVSCDVVSFRLYVRLTMRRELDCYSS